MEIIVVDDESPDGTSDAVSAYAVQRPWLHLIRRKAKPSLSGSVMDGLRLARGDILCVMDADLSHDPALLPRMIALIRQGTEIVVGSRRITGGGVTKWPWYRRSLSLVGNYLARSLLRLSVVDAMSGYFAMSRYFYESVKDYVEPHGYKILLEFCVHGCPKFTRELPYIFQDRKQGYSKFTFHTGYEYLKMLVRLTVQCNVNNLRRAYHMTRYNKILPLIKEGRLLDIGCARPCEGMSDGAFLDFRNKKGFGLDIKPCHIRFPFVQAAADHLPFRDHIFNTIVAMEMIEHLDEYQLEAALREFSRVTAAGGRVIMTTPNNSCLWRIIWFFWRHSGGKKLWKSAHKLSYTKIDWIKILRQHFELRKIRNYLGVLLLIELEPFSAAS
jgi:dolichol-phosphate mannosyltransferase